MFPRTRTGVTSLVASGLLAASLGGALAAAPSAAAAAYPWCTSSAWTQSADTTWTTRPSTSNTNTTCVMAQGSTGAGVTSLQKALRHCYGRNIAIDGVFGPATEAALKYAQGRAGVSQDGEYGPVTRNAILWADTASRQVQRSVVHEARGSQSGRFVSSEVVLVSLDGVAEAGTCRSDTPDSLDRWGE
ncbi:peptidoglycan-binding domain-containing protein [Streptomyces tendae]|uniref:Peptidoglycan-binding protein n=1 Tax=Streptomyces tendae TaxID=1932 RepID=A0ABX6A0S4_STRTE|nr:peptidoglycan-binding protein [Streptomyces tendae]